MNAVQKAQLLTDQQIKDELICGQCFNFAAAAAKYLHSKPEVESIILSVARGYREAGDLDVDPEDEDVLIHCVVSFTYKDKSYQLDAQALTECYLNNYLSQYADEWQQFEDDETDRDSSHEFLYFIYPLEHEEYWIECRVCGAEPSDEWQEKSLPVIKELTSEIFKD